MLTSKKKQHGFTIVELLIVIVVIAILAAITIVAYNGIQIRARDTQRKNDIATIQKALEMYHIDNGGYPACADSPYKSGDARGSCHSNSSGFVSALTPKYLNSLPVDPINGGENRYRYFYGSKKTSNTTYAASFDDNYVLMGTYESQNGPYVIQMGADTKINFVLGSDN